MGGWPAASPPSPTSMCGRQLLGSSASLFRRVTAYGPYRRFATLHQMSEVREGPDSIDARRDCRWCPKTDVDVEQFLGVASSTALCLR
jgi:hypothetical protein